MSTTFPILTAALAGSLALLAGTSYQPTAPAKPATSNFAIVELFTSEGCSSCPPADDLLAKLSTDAATKKQNVLFLALHVDYWDHLGWKDRFATSDFSKRQRTYAAALSKSGKDGNVYTPQMIVNGSEAFVGSDANLARAAIDKALAATPAITIQAVADPRKSSDPVHITATITGESKDAEILFALVEDNLSTDAKKGENAGRTLHHTRVVRALAHAPIKDHKSAADLAIPTDAKPDHCHIVLFAQNPTTMHILGAAQMAFPPISKPADAKPSGDTKPSPAPTR